MEGIKKLEIFVLFKLIDPILLILSIYSVSIHLKHVLYLQLKTIYKNLMSKY